MSDNIMLDAALAYVEEGFRVFPLNGKVPVTAHGFKDFTQTQAGCREIWGKNPNFNIGIVTEGLVVIDFDIKTGGKESRAKMIEDHGPMVKTRVHRTGGGGQHWIYSNPFGVDIRNSTKFAGYPGVDIRATGGYICAPPSIHPDTKKPYEVIDPSPIAVVPDWIIDAATKKLAQSLPATGEEIVLADGERNATLTSLAGTMRRKGMGYDAILAALKATKCQNPLPDKEIETIAKSSMRWKPDPLESIPITVQTVQLDVNTVQTVQPVQTEKDCTNTVQPLNLSIPSRHGECGILTPPLPPHPTPGNPPPLPTPYNERNEKDMNGGDVAILRDKLDTAVWRMVNKWLELHIGERFDFDTLCRHLDIKTRDQRQSVSKKLSYEVSRGNIEKSNTKPPIFLYPDTRLVRLKWLDASSQTTYDLQWPMGQDGTIFGFDGHVSIPAAGLIVIAGVTNTGKSAWCRNFLWRNMDAHKSFYFSSETSAEDFADYAGRMLWGDPINEDGKGAKFELVYRNQDFRSVIQPDAINIIDWLSMGDSFYGLGRILEGIKEKTTGVTVVAIQKDAAKDLGMGGMWGEHLASLYITLDYNRLTVVKAKKPMGDFNPNGRSWGFDIIDRGANFANIRLLKRCGYCWKGKLKNNQPCNFCTGTGFVDDTFPNTGQTEHWADRYNR